MRSHPQEELSSERDRVLLAVKRSTAPIRELSTALLRAKRTLAGAPTSKQAEMLRVIDIYAGSLKGSKRDRLHAVALVTSLRAATLRQASKG